MALEVRQVLSGRSPKWLRAGFRSGGHGADVINQRWRSPRPIGSRPGQGANSCTRATRTNPAKGRPPDARSGAGFATAAVVTFAEVTVVQRNTGAGHLVELTVTEVVVGAVLRVDGIACLLRRLDLQVAVLREPGAWDQLAEDDVLPEGNGSLLA